MSVTVIIPNFNNERFLTQCLGSVRSDPAVSAIIIYDNASTDGSLALIESIADPKVSLIRGAENIGATQARHRAVTHAATKYLFFLDGDDFLAPGTVSAGYEAAEAGDLDLAVPEMVRVSAEGLDATPFIVPPTKVLDGPGAFMMTVGGWDIHPMGVLRLDTYLAGARSFSFHGYSDDELLTRHLLLAASRVGGCGGTYHYRSNPKPPSTRRSVSQLRTNIAVLAMAVGVASPAAEARLRRQRNDAARALAGLLRRSVTGAADLEEARALFAEFDKVRVRWAVRDAPYFLAARLSRLFLKLR